MLDPGRGTRLLDFGTGTGSYAIAIAKHRPDLHVIAFDEQREMLEFLREKLRREPLHNLTVMLAGDPEKPKAERVLCLNVLHELGDEALAEVRASLTPGGVVLFVDWNAGAERPVGPPNDHVYTISEAHERLAAHGFRVVREAMLPYHYALLATQADSRATPSPK